jgi:hypothetical protein
MDHQVISLYLFDIQLIENYLAPNLGHEMVIFRSRLN